MWRQPVISMQFLESVPTVNLHPASQPNRRQHCSRRMKQSQHSVGLNCVETGVLDSWMSCNHWSAHIQQWISFRCGEWREWLCVPTKCHLAASNRMQHWAAEKHKVVNHCWFKLQRHANNLRFCIMVAGNKAVMTTTQWSLGHKELLDPDHCVLSADGKAPSLSNLLLVMSKSYQSHPHCYQCIKRGPLLHEQLKTKHLNLNLQN